MTLSDGKYFIAILPPPALREELQTLKEEISTKYFTRGALKSPPHITLHMPFIWPHRKEEKLINALETFVSGIPCPEVHLHGYGSFPPRVVYVSVEENPAMKMYQKQLSRYCKLELNLFNANYQDRPFHPHITLAFRDLKKEQFEKLWNDLKERDFQAAFQAAAITVLRHDGKQWQPLRDFLFR